MGTDRKLAAPKFGVRLTSISTVAVLATGSSILGVGGSTASATIDDMASPTALTIKLPPAIAATDLTASRSTAEAVAPGVTVYAWPSPEFDKKLKEGDTFNLFEVEAKIAVAGEELAVNIDPASIPQEYASDAGIVDLQVQVSDPAAGWTDMSNVSVQRVQTADGVAWNRTSAGDSQETSRTTSATDAALPASVDLSGGEPEPQSQVASLAGVAASPADNCIYFGGTATYVSSTRPEVKTAATFALGDGSASTGRVVYSSTSTHSTTTGIALTTDGTSWAANGTKTVSASWSHAWNYNKSKHKAYHIEIDYGKYRQQYVKQIKSNGQCTTFVDYYGTGYVYRPRFETGGVNAVNQPRPDAYTHCVTADNGTWTRKDSSGNAYSNSGGVKISGTIGINLSVSSNFSNSKKLQYKIAGDKRVCGRSTGPLYDAVPMLRFMP